MEEKPNTTRRTLLRWLAAVLLLVVLYVPSTGPAVFIRTVCMGDDNVSGPVILSIYAPIVTWIRRQRPRWSPFDEYIHRWYRLGIIARGYEGRPPRSQGSSQ